MVTKIKPYRIRDVNVPEEGNSLQYNDPNTFVRGEGGGGGSYVAGENIQINGNVISATDTTYIAGRDIEIVDGPGGDETVTGNTSILLERAVADGLNSVTLTGGCEQTATPTPSTPVDITTNNGDITVSPNLFRTLGTTTTQGGVTFSVQPDGSVVCSGRATSYYSYYLGRADFDPGTIDKITVAINGTYNATGNIVVDKFHVYSGSTSLGTISYTNWTQYLTVDIANDYPTADNIRVYLKRNSNTDTDAIIKPMAVKGTVNKAWKPYGKITIDGTVETVEDELGNTATAEMLLAMNTYADTQELLSGVVNRQLAILVLTGTEAWLGSTSNNYFSLEKTNINPAPISTGVHCYCTHFVSDSSNYTNTAGTFWLGGSYLNINYDNQGGTSSSANMTAFKNWLKAQYANGTPVIIVYPLATETTETVTGQTLTTIEGDNTLTITQASIDNLPIEANYDKIGGLTINYTGDDSADVNTKTFFLTGTTGQSNLDEAQALVDWLTEDMLTPSLGSPLTRNAIIVYNNGQDIVNETFILNGSGDGSGAYGNFRFSKIDLTHAYGLTANISSARVNIFVNYNGSKWIVDEIEVSSLSDRFLSTDNTGSYTPTNNYNPATKKYVDDTVASVISAGATAPSNPTEGNLWYDTTNNILKVYDGTNWNEVGGDAANIEYVTEQEYNDLPSSKFSDGKHYIQYKSTGLLTLEELSNMCIESWEEDINT